MQLDQLKENIDKLVEEGHGKKEVFTRHGASGDCQPIGNARLSVYFNEAGPFDIEEGTEYISIYIGN